VSHCVVCSSLGSPALFLVNVPPSTHTYPLSLHDALPISMRGDDGLYVFWWSWRKISVDGQHPNPVGGLFCRSEGSEPSAREDSRSEEHTSELQSRFDLVCRLLLEKKKNSQGR